VPILSESKGTADPRNVDSIGQDEGSKSLNVQYKGKQRDSTPALSSGDEKYGRSDKRQKRATQTELPGTAFTSWTLSTFTHVAQFSISFNYFI